MNVPESSFNNTYTDLRRAWGYAKRDTKAMSVPADEPNEIHTVLP
jgi:hypothetical protein